MDKSDFELVSGLAAIASHGACLLGGAYKGSLHAGGQDCDVPFRYLWGANIASTGITNATSSSILSRPASKAAKGAALGAVAGPLEFTIGYAVGYVGRIVYETVFS